MRSFWAKDAELLGKRCGAFIYAERIIQQQPVIQSDVDTISQLTMSIRCSYFAPGNRQRHLQVNHQAQYG